MRSRAILLSLFGAVLLVVPSVAYAGIPFFGPIIPTAYNVCPASWGMLITVINNIISFLITIAIVFVAPIMFAYAGFLFVVNPVNQSGITKARGVLWSTIVGIVLALSGYMIVAAVMAIFYHPSGSVLGAWSSIISGNSTDVCLKQAGSGLTTASGTPITGVGSGGSGGTLLSFGTGPCEAGVLKGIVPELTTSQANTFACIAKWESVCGTVMQNYSWNKDTGNGKASTAYGAFQVTLSGNHVCFENTACYTAAGVSGPLNCHQGFTPTGFTTGGNSTILQNCMKAAANLACNTTAAFCVYKKQGFNAWTGDPSGARAQKQCIAEHAGQ
ncbi:MAG: hypothetical protein AAB442_02475 [Patescibacteria group bacterium]